MPIERTEDEQIAGQGRCSGDSALGGEFPFLCTIGQTDPVHFVAHRRHVHCPGILVYQR